MDFKFTENNLAYSRQKEIIFLLLMLEIKPCI